jgi:hypothetical protein
MDAVVAVRVPADEQAEVLEVVDVPAVVEAAARARRLAV